ncbi:outer membrane protein [Cysteiniphilum marinum]|uniref:outer membrane protein n=1 Tax=Cysteiniphilum marinum TaxID=2774191 RepID=UPI001939CCCB|nr:outer membrane beta-barrel protein [Cysteiniphilum marinum]
MKDGKKSLSSRLIRGLFYGYKWEQKPAAVFFILVVLGLMFLSLNRFLPKVSFLGLFFPAIVMVLILVFLVGGYFGLKWFVHSYYRKTGNNPVSHIPQLLKSLKRFNKVQFWFVVLAIVLLFSMFKPSQAAYLLNAHTVNQKQSLIVYDLQSGWVIKPSFNLSFPKATISGYDKQTGYYGFGLSGGYQYALNAKHSISALLGYNQNSKSTFSNAQGQFSASLHDVNLLAQYQYRVLPNISLGVNGGIAFVFGFNDGAIDNFYRGFSPVFGGSIGYQLSESMLIDLGYAYYFGKSASDAYSSKNGNPSISRLALGVSYVF